MATNLSFLDKYDLARFMTICEDMRKVAGTWPAFDEAMKFVEDYRRKIGPWIITFYLKIWDDKPMWVGKANVIEQVGWRTEEGDMGVKFEVPQDGFLMLESWEPEHFDQARYILSSVFGPILRPGDEHQPAAETKGPFCLWWEVPYEGDMSKWRKLRLH